MPSFQRTPANICTNLTLTETVESLSYMSGAHSMGTSAFVFYAIVFKCHAKEVPDLQMRKKNLMQHSHSCKIKVL